MISDAVEVAKSLTQSGKSLESRLDDRIELLQCAEENYYRIKSPDKQVNCVNFSPLILVLKTELIVRGKVPCDF